MISHHRRSGVGISAVLAAGALALGSVAYAQAAPNQCRDVPRAPGVQPTALVATGASIAVLDSAALSSLGGRTLSDALAARLPGVSVMRSSGVAGTGSRIRMRGPSGLVIPQAPIVFVDGIRIDDEMQSIGIDNGGQAPSRLDDIPLDDVACVHVLRGPAATASYGTDAAGGVIVVTTRAAARPATPGPRVRMFAEGGASGDAGDYPANYGSTGVAPNTQVRSWSPLDAVSPFRTAPVAIVGLSSTIALSRSVSASVAGRAGITDGPFRNNSVQRYSGAVGATFSPSSTLTVRSRAWWIGSAAELPYVGGFVWSVLTSALLGNSVDDPIRRGYRTYPLYALEEISVDQRARRLGGSVDGEWRPVPWLALGGTVGREDSRVDDVNDSPFPRTLPSGEIVVDPPTGATTAEHRTQRNSATLFASLQYGAPTLRGTTSLSGHYLGDSRRAVTQAFQYDPGNPTGSYSFRWRDVGVRGLVATQRLASLDRRFVEVGARRDHLSDSFFALQDPTYLFANAAWDVSKETVFPAAGVVPTLRLRGAYGESGDSRPYEATLDDLFTVPIGTPTENDQPGVEKAKELEVGADIGLLGDRVSANGTWFRKRTTGGLMRQPIPPGVGLPGSTFAPVASWETRGTELAVTLRLIERASTRVTLAVSYTQLHNEVLSLGNTPPIAGTAYRIMPGYPLYGVWGPGYTYTDVNGDGRLVPAEVVADTFRFLGSPVPTRELAVAPTITIGRSLSLAGLVDSRSGYRQYNNTERLRCSSVCAGRYATGLPLSEQARSVDPTDAGGGWIEDGSFVRLREVTLAWTLPTSLGRLLRARSSSLTLAGRNLVTWTDYSGLDPEVSLGGQTSFLQTDFFVQPLPRTLSLRLDARW